MAQVDAAQQTKRDCRVAKRAWRPTIIRGANERLTPILMTAILTAMGLAPLAFSFGQPGQEISGPMAITILGGLASSTILNVAFLPALAARFSR